MRFEIAIPDPSTMRVGKEFYHSLPAGAELHRIHPHRFGADQFNVTAGGDARFSPIRDAAGTVIPTIYGAQTFDCAACEVILRLPDVPVTAPATAPPPLQIVFPADYAQHDHSVVRTTVELRLVDVTTAGQRRIGIPGNALMAGPKSTYPRTREWAERIHSACPDAHGIYYSSYQLGPLFALVLFGDRVAAGNLDAMGTRPVARADCHAEIRHLAQSLSIDYQDI